MTEPLTIGINTFFQHSFFSSGLATCALSLADALKRLGHNPILVNTAGKQDWYEDCQELKGKYERRNMMEWTFPKLDIFIDIDGFIIPAERYKIAKKVVVFYRKQPFLNEQESTVYPIAQPVRNMRDCDAVWTWSEFSQQDVHILELLSGRPVYRVPYTWSPSGADTYSKAYPTWLDAAKTAPDGPWICHITESNMSIASNSTLPMVGLAYAKTHAKDVLIKQYFLHNAQNIEQQQFFKENVLAHVRRDDLEPLFVGRQRIGDWRLQPKTFILSHIRFVRLKPMHLDAVWNGIPIIHNSPFLKSLGNGLERLYYEDNSIKGINKAIECMDADFKAGTGFFSPGVHQTLRSAILTRLDPGQHIDSWTNILNATMSSVPGPVATAVVSPKAKLRVGFSDMWQSANCDYNFWTLLLSEAGRQMNPPMEVEGVAITAKNAATEAIDLLFFAPFGDTWKNVPESVPKVHFTGEPWSMNDYKETYLQFGFDDTNLEKKRYRFPLWAQYIDWFGADQERLVNPRTLPIDSLAHPVYKAQDRKKFAAFVVTNPGNKVRNEAFHWLSQYKQVDSAGRLFNNIGSDIFVENAGGGGGELKKHEFLKNYKFCFAYENNRNNGYITEKMLAAKAAGCVPLYWGALDVVRDFPAGSFLDCNSFNSPEELISAVQALDTDDTLWEKYANTAAINVDVERKRLAEIANLVLKPVVPEFQLKSMPSILGAASTTEAAVLGRLRGEIINPVVNTVKPLLQISSEPAKHLSKPIKDFKWNGKTLLVACATERFMESLTRWLHTTKPRFSDAVRARVYIGEDVQDSAIRLLQTDFPTVEFMRLPTGSVKAPGFNDLWEPQHFAWKLWIYQQLVQEEALANTLVWYMDAASIIVRWPEEWLTEATRSGICMLEDAEQKNDQWCHEEFCQRLMVTPQELEAQQVVGGIMAFVAGSLPAWKTFTEAWILGQQRGIIVGPKWSGIRPDGKPYGHRHDQSILSILRLRNKVPVKPLASVYNHESLRRCNKAGAALYIHRGQFKEHDNFAPRIGEVHLISLARRKDRIQRFKENHEAWTKTVCLRPAYDGRRLSITPAIAKLFRPNDFLWKKAIMGCAISHLSLWLELAAEPASCENYLILEDDVKFQKGWLGVWEKAAKHIPEDYDVLYLGGVLPPNRQVFEQVLEPVNPFWNRVKPNQIFGQREPTTYFHFCNYAYILSRRGAQKVLEEISRRGGYYTSADHMICNRVGDMKHYVLNPVVAGCYQDDDPKYQTSEFNNFNRVDGFDSDLWNNDERFSEDEIINAISQNENKPFPIQQVIFDAHSATLATEIQQTPVSPSPTAENTVPEKPSGRFFTVGDHAINPKALLEYSWLREVFGPDFETIQQLPQTTDPVENAIYIFMKPHFNNYLPLFMKHESTGIPFNVLHLSDEHGNDPVHFYEYNSCKKVVRIYHRPECKMEKVITIPLGSYRRSGLDDYSITGRKLLWNFYGTNWKGREALLEPWKTVTPNSFKFYGSWMDSQQLSSDDYTKMCLNTLFMPCPAGQNIETFRLYEALDHGCIPIYVRQPGDDDYFAFLNKHLPIVGFQNWDQPIGFIKNLFQNNTVFLQYYTEMCGAWKRWRQSLTSEVQQQLNLRS